MFEFLGPLNLEKHTSSLCSNAVASSIIDNNQDMETTSTNSHPLPSKSVPNDVVAVQQLKTGDMDENGIKPQPHITPHLVPEKQELPSPVPHQPEKLSLDPELLKTPMLFQINITHLLLYLNC